MLINALQAFEPKPKRECRQVYRCPMYSYNQRLPFFFARSKLQFFGVIVKPSTPCPLPAAALRAPNVGVEATMPNPSSDALLPDIEGFEVPCPRAFILIDSPSAACALLGAALTAADTGVLDRVDA